MKLFSVLVCLLLIAAAYLNYVNLKLVNKYPIVIPGIPELKTKKKKNKYVILAGPHKTASTSIQYNLYIWSKSGLLGDDWAWMHPNVTCLREASPIYCPDVKAVFYNKDWFFKAWSCLSICLRESYYRKNNGTDQCTRVKSCYSESLQTQQKEEHQLKLVFGTEYIATLLVSFLIERNDPSIFIQGFLDTLPSSAAKNEVTFVITYRSPRMDHLRSWWKEAAHQRNQTLSFRSFLSGEFYTSLLDPLYAAEELAARHGFNVIVIDMSGVQAKGWDVSSVVACQILDNVPCHLDNMTLLHGSNVSTPSLRNVRKNTMEELNNLTLDETLQISNALQKLDCNSVHAIFHHPRIQVLYPYDLNHTLYSCIQKQPFYSHERLKTDIQSIVSEGS
jgi:hypothetical protein